MEFVTLGDLAFKEEASRSVPARVLQVLCLMYGLSSSIEIYLDVLASNQNSTLSGHLLEAPALPMIHRVVFPDWHWGFGQIIYDF